MKTKNHISESLALLAFLFAPIVAQAQYATPFGRLWGSDLSGLGYQAIVWNIGTLRTTRGSAAPPLAPGTIYSSPNQILPPVVIDPCVSLPYFIQSIGDYSFSSNALVCINFPSNLVHIGEAAFAHCQNLTNIAIPNSVTSIDALAFVLCTNLTSVTIGSGITSLPPGLFGANTKLSSVIMPGNQVNPGPVTGFELNLAAGGTFEQCTSLTNIFLPFSLTNIGHLAFSRSGLRSVAIPPLVRYIGFRAFSDCPNLRGVALASYTPAYMTNMVIDEFAFAGCTNLQNVFIWGDAPGSVASNLFAGSPVTVFCQDGTSGWGTEFGGAPVVRLSANGYVDGRFTIQVANGAVTITGYLGPFGNQVVEIPASLGGYPVTTIGANAFAGVGIDGGVVVIPASVTSIESEAFAGCTSLNKIILGPRVSNISIGAFRNCTGLTSVEFPDSVTLINNAAFSGCTNLAWASFGAGLRSLDISAFSSCPKFTNAFFTGSVPAIYGGSSLSPATTIFYPYTTTAASWASAFPGSPLRAWDPVSKLHVDLVSGVMSVTGVSPGVTEFPIPPAIGGHLVNRIAANAFQNNSFIHKIIIPSSITSIGNNAFNSSGIATLLFKGNAPLLGVNAFTGCTNLTRITRDPDKTGWGSIGSLFGGVPTALWSAQAECTYMETNGTCILTNYVGLGGGSLEIPATLGGVPVTQIAKAFGYYALVDSITLPASINRVEALSLVNQRVYFEGNAPIFAPNAAPGSTLYYDPTTTGWGFVGSEYVPWSQSVPCTLSLINGAFRIDRYLGAGGPINIPSAIAGYPVGSIGNGAFAVSGITSVVLPDSITDIGDYAFYTCTNLVSTTMSYGVTNIGFYAFANTPQSAITLPFGVNTIGDYAFALCGALKNVYFQGNIPALGGDHVFLGTPANVLFQLGALGWGWGDTLFSKRATHLWIPPLPYGFFYTNSALTVTHCTATGGVANIPGSVIGIPVTGIGKSAFENSPITSLTMPDSITHIDDFAFMSCDVLQSVALSANLVSIGQAAFAYSGLTNLTLPATFTDLGPYAFAYSAQLSKIFFKGNAPTQLANAFLSTPSTIYFDPATLGWNPIGANFAGQPTGIWSGQIPSLLTYANGGIGIGQYLGLGGAVNIPAAIGGYPVTSIRTNAFVFSAINSLTIPDSVQSIGDYAFYGSSSLTSAIIGNGVTNIGQYTFAYCSALNSISVGNSVKTIGSSAFTSCAALTSITLPASLTSLGDLAFYNCGSLQSVFFKGNAPALGGGFVFDSTPATVYYLAGRTNWGPTLASHTAVLWNPLIQASGPGLGVQGNQFRFKVTGPANIPITIESTTNLANPVWQRGQTVTLTNGSVQFNDIAYPINPKRFYRISSP